MSRQYFGTDGVRGQVGDMPITPEFVLRLGYSAGRVLVNHKRDAHPTVLIGKDTRISGYMLEAALQAGFSAAGVNVLLSGPLPTPGIAYLTRALRLSAGVMISASHNPYHDNGIKFFAEGGIKLADSIELEIESLLEQPLEVQPSLGLGRVRRIEGAADRYIEFCKSSFPYHDTLRRLKLVIDCANGATYHIAPKVFHELGAEVIPIADKPNGYNINEKTGTTHPQTLQEAVLQHSADYGIALDGDGDRLMMVDRHGQIFDGDQLMYVIIKARILHGELKGGVVGTVMTNMALERALNKLGVAFERAKVGDRYVLEVLNKKGWQIGGEASGHILCLDKHSTGDGIISALQVLNSVHLLKAHLADICTDWHPFPQTHINVRLMGQDWQLASQQALYAAQTALNGQGRIILRPSGTEPVVRIMVEAEAADLAEKWAKAIAHAIQNVA